MSDISHENDRVFWTHVYPEGVFEAPQQAMRIPITEIVSSCIDKENERFVPRELILFVIA